MGMKIKTARLGAITLRLWTGADHPQRLRLFRQGQYIAFNFKRGGIALRFNR